MEKLISVIVPIYNVEKFLNKCIESILCQTYVNLEIILVDDGSTDNCSKLCDEYAIKDTRIKVIHKSNGGLSDARNVGIDVANGEFLFFVDSDDYINKNTINTLYMNLINEDADVSICKYKVVYDQNTDTNEIQDNIVKVIEEEKFNNIYNELADYTITAWAKLYKKSIFDEIRFPVGKINEDEFIVHQWLNLAKKVVYSSCEYYYYFQRGNSIMNTYNIKRLDIFDALENRMLFFKGKNKELYSQTLYVYCYNILKNIRLLKQGNNIINKKHIIKDLKKKNKIYLKKLLLSGHINILRKVKIMLLNLKMKLSIH